MMVQAATANRFDERVVQATGAPLHAERISTI